MSISFAVTPVEADLIVKIADRALRMAKEVGTDLGTPLDLEMDLTATHCNGRELRLSDLLAAPEFDFVHDVWGIVNHLDRTTGALTRCFVPRYSASQS
jgi:hypothetical protein